LEAALNDLASGANPEYKYRIKNKGPGKEIVVSIKTQVAGRFTDLILGLHRPSRDIDSADPRNIRRDIQNDFKRRSRSPAGSMADFKSASPNVIVEDLDRMIESRSFVNDGLNAIRQRYRTAWDYVWAYPLGYSDDGKLAVVVFDSPSGIHGGDWVYMLRKQGNRWEVVWRHLHNYK
jgi:hypothetical protein